MQFKFDLHPDRNLYVGFFKDVEAAESLQQRLQQGAGVDSVAVVDASLVLHAMQIRAAAALALEHEMNEKLITHEIHSEFLFCLGPSKNIQKSMALVSPQSGVSSVVVVKFDPTEAHVEIIAETVKGHSEDLGALGQCCNKAKLAKLFGIDEASKEQAHSTLLQSLILRIGTKFVR